MIGTDPDANKLDVEKARLTEISNRFVDAQAAMYDAETRQRQMEEARAKDLSDESVNVQQNPLLQNLKTELARASAKFADTSQRYDHNHPQYISAQAELESLRSKVAAEVDNANRAVAGKRRVARQNMTDLQRAMEQQRKRILDLQHNQDEYSVLKRDEESARTAYDSAMQRGNETQLESRLNNTNTAILNYAFPPMKPSSPRLLLNLALAFILGSMLAVGASLIKERFDQRIHSRVDLLEGADIAVLAELPRVRISMRRHRRSRGRFRSKGTKTADGARILWRGPSDVNKNFADSARTDRRPIPVDTRLGELLHERRHADRARHQGHIGSTAGQRRSLWRGGIAFGAGERTGCQPRACPADLNSLCWLRANPI